VIASRFSLAVAALLGLALVPTIIHEYVGLSIDDGLVTTAVEMKLAGLSGAATGRKPSWAVEKFESNDWIERWYTGGGERIQLLVVRSYDLKRLYHHPELAVVRSDDLASPGTVRLAHRNAVPIHVFESRRTSGRGVAMYALLYGTEFIDDAIQFQLRTAASLLGGGRRQMTLFFVYDDDVPTDVPLDDIAATRLLLGAVDSFVSQSVAPERVRSSTRVSVPRPSLVSRVAP
jgi:hypothetical protein